MNEIDVLRGLLARMESYEISAISHVRGRFYDVTMRGQRYSAVILDRSFSYYELRYHVGRHKPTLVFCNIHDSVLPIPVLALHDSRINQPFDHPTGFEEIEEKRHSKTGSRVLLGMLLSAVQRGYDLIEEQDFPKATRNRYLARIEELGRRKRGRPVGEVSNPAKERKKERHEM